jgi:hypothetical protein
MAVAQRSEPTSTPRDSLPNPARIWTSSNPNVLEPSPSDTDDPRRDPATQTQDGKFTARCPGRATVRVTSGWESKGKRVVVPSASGPLVRSFRRRARSQRAGTSPTLAKIVLAQPAEVEVRVSRGKVVARPLHRCLRAGRAYGVRWSGTIGKRRAKRGLYDVATLVRSDRGLQVYRQRVRVR